MTDVFVERQWAPPLSDSDFHALLASSGGCLATHRCDWYGSLLSSDGRDLFCHFRAPDIESVRIAMRQLGSPPGAYWSGSIHDAPDFTPECLERANVLVARRFHEPVDFDEIQALEIAGKGCLESHRVRFVRTFFSADRKRMICVYEAPDAESVRIAQREAQMPLERVWAIRRYAP